MKPRNRLVFTSVAAAIALAACQPAENDAARTTAPTAVASDAAQSSRKETAGEAVERARRAAKTDDIIRQADDKIKAADARLKKITDRAKSLSRARASE